MPPPPQLCRSRLRAGLGWAGLGWLGWAGGGGEMPHSPGRELAACVPAPGHGDAKLLPPFTWELIRSRSAEDTLPGPRPRCPGQCWCQAESWLGDRVASCSYEGGLES